EPRGNFLRPLVLRHFNAGMRIEHELVLAQRHRLRLGNDGRFRCESIARSYRDKSREQKHEWKSKHHQSGPGANKRWRSFMRHHWAQSRTAPGIERSPASAGPKPAGERSVELVDHLGGDFATHRIVDAEREVATPLVTIDLVEEVAHIEIELPCIIKLITHA